MMFLTTPLLLWLRLNGTSTVRTPPPSLLSRSPLATPQKMSLHRGGPASLAPAHYSTFTRVHAVGALQGASGTRKETTANSSPLIYDQKVLQ